MEEHSDSRDLSEVDMGPDKLQEMRGKIEQGVFPADLSNLVSNISEIGSSPRRNNTVVGVNQNLLRYLELEPTGGIEEEPPDATQETIGNGQGLSLP